MAKSESASLRHLPSVSEADQHLRALGLPTGKAVRPIVEVVLQGFRERALHGNGNGAALPQGEALRATVLEAIAAAVRHPGGKQLRRVINATGVVVHTNLGRALLRPGELQSVTSLLGGYLNLEFDIEA